MKAMRRPRAIIGGTPESPFYLARRKIRPLGGFSPGLREYGKPELRKWQDIPEEREKYFHVDFKGFGIGGSKDAMLILRDLLSNAGRGEQAHGHEGHEGHGSEASRNGSHGHLPTMRPEVLKRIALAKAKAEEVQMIVDKMNHSRAIVNLGEIWNPGRKPGFKTVSLGATREFLSALVFGRGGRQFDKVSGPAYKITRPNFFGKIPGMRGNVGPAIDSSIRDSLNALTFFYRRANLKISDAVRQEHALDLEKLKTVMAELNRVSRKILPHDIELYNEAYRNYWSNRVARARTPHAH